MDNGVSIRKYPYPYRAALAICSDLDLTLDRHVYFETAKFLNTAQETRMGKGVGLEVGNTIYFDMPPGHFSYWNTDDAGRGIIHELIQSGHIDCIHSYGALATTRKHAGRAIDELTRNRSHIRVWVDHATAPTNFGSDIMKGSGDLIGAEAYHADMTFEYGIRYVWRGRVSSRNGQEGKGTIGAIVNRFHKSKSTVTAVKEASKCFLGRMGSNKYEMHGANRLTRIARLRDGRTVVEFIRSNPFWGGVGLSATADGLAEVLTEEMLGQLVRDESCMILYTHLGKARNSLEPLGEKTRESLRELKRFSTEGKILVTTTRRLLDYQMVRYLARVDIAETDDGCNEYRIHAESFAAGGELEAGMFSGLTIYADLEKPFRVLLNGRPCETKRNDKDHTRRRSISVGWPKLEFPYS